MNEQVIQRILHEIEEERVPNNVDLWPAIRAQLAQTQAAQPPGSPHSQRSGASFARFVSPFRSVGRLAWAALFVALIGALIFAAIGPQQVLAQVQRLLGYVPRVGIVELADSRVLRTPVELTRDGVTLRVLEVVTQADKTVVVFESEGLPPTPSPSGRTLSSGDIAVTLVLPSGQVLESDTWSWRYGGGTFEFPPLPEDVERITLEVSRLPLVEAGAAPDRWVVPLVLGSATNDMVTRFPEPYTPTGVSASHDGITVRVEEVVHAPEETLVTVSAEWNEAQGRWRGFTGIVDGYQTRLYDDVGHIYRETSPLSEGEFSQWVVEHDAPARTVVVTDGEGNVIEERRVEEATKAFAALSQTARHLTLEVRGVELVVPVDERLTLDLGNDPQAGDYWPLDRQIMVADVPINIRGASLQEEVQYGPEGETEQHTEYLLALDIEILPHATAQQVIELSLTSAAGSSGSRTGYSFNPPHIETALTFRQLPRGEIILFVSSATVRYVGPWQLEWPLPEEQLAEGTAITPMTIEPPCEAATATNGVRLCLDEVTQTDRLTALRVRAADVPTGTRFEGILQTSEQDDSPFVTDAQGNRYEPLGGQQSPVRLAWQNPEPVGWLDVRTPPFPPLGPSAERATLHVDSVGLTLLEDVTFEVMVPDTNLSPRANERPFPRASEPWAVDIPIEIAGYTMRWQEATLSEWGSRVLLQIMSSPFDIAPGQHPPRVAAVGGHHRAGRSYPVSRRARALLWGAAWLRRTNGGWSLSGWPIRRSGSSARR